MFRAALQRRRKNSSPTVNFGNFPVTGIRAKGMLVSESQGPPAGLRVPVHCLRRHSGAPTFAAT